MKKERQVFILGQVVFLRHQRGRAFEKFTIVDESPRSWLVRTDGMRSYQASFKIPKTLKDWVVGTEYDANLFNWAMKNRWTIGGALSYTNDAKLLLHVAQTLKLDCLQTVPEEKQEDSNEKI